MAPGRSYGSGNNEERITVSRPKPRPQMKTSDTGSNSEPQVILVEFLSIPTFMRVLVRRLPDKSTGPPKVGPSCA